MNNNCQCNQESLYTIKYNPCWGKWQVSHPEIAPVVAEFNTQQEALEYVLKG